MNMLLLDVYIDASRLTSLPKLEYTAILRGSCGLSGLGSACDPTDPGSIPRHCCLLLFP